MNLPGIILVTGTDTGVGKTITTAALAAVMQGTGRSVAVYKPCQSGAADGDSDAGEIVRLTGVTAEAGIVLQEPMAPLAAAAVDGTPLPGLAAHAERIRQLSASYDHVLVEGAGGLLVELDSDGGTLADLGSLLAAAFVLVARPGLGTLNHTALTLEVLSARGLDVLGVVLGTWPLSPDAVHHSNRQVLGALRVPLLGVLPEGAAEMLPPDFRAGAAAWLNGLPA
jgi:dethiobiotin synthetase